MRCDQYFECLVSFHILLMQSPFERKKVYKSGNSLTERSRNCGTMERIAMTLGTQTPIRP